VRAGEAVSKARDLPMDYPVEIKANIEASFIEAALDVFGLADAEAEHRSIYFLETSGPPEPLALYSQDVILRFRGGGDKAPDCTLKFRPCDVDRLPDSWNSPREGDAWEFRIEQDWTGATPTPSASLSASLPVAVADAVANGGAPSLLLTPDQLELFDLYTSQPLNTAQLRLLGPLASRKWTVKGDRRVNNREVGRKIHVEEWVIGDDLRFLEFSAREDELATAEETRRELDALYISLGLLLSTTQQLKTKIALDHFVQAGSTI
jgi:hypothetical protein